MLTLGNNTKWTKWLFWLSLVMHLQVKIWEGCLFLKFSICHELIIISWSDSRTHYSETYAKINVNYLWKQISCICNSIFSLMVHVIKFGLGMSNICLASFVKVVLYFSRYSLFELCTRWIVCSLSLTLSKKPLFLPSRLYLLRFVNRERALFVADL